VYAYKYTPYTNALLWFMLSALYTNGIKNAASNITHYTRCPLWSFHDKQAPLEYNAPEPYTLKRFGTSTLTTLQLAGVFNPSSHLKRRLSQSQVKKTATKTSTMIEASMTTTTLEPIVITTPGTTITDSITVTETSTSTVTIDIPPACTNPTRYLVSASSSIYFPKLGASCRDKAKKRAGAVWV